MLVALCLLMKALTMAAELSLEALSTMMSSVRLKRLSLRMSTRRVSVVLSASARL